MSEVVRCEELPAQWEKYPLSTQLEMRAGRNSNIDAKIAQWADEGEAFLRKQFPNKGLWFNSSWSVEHRTITLHVRRRTKRDHADGLGSYWDELLFEETCKAENFVSHLMVTKILMVM